MFLFVILGCVCVCVSSLLGAAEPNPGHGGRHKSFLPFTPVASLSIFYLCTDFAIRVSWSTCFLTGGVIPSSLLCFYAIHRLSSQNFTMKNDLTPTSTIAQLFLMTPLLISFMNPHICYPKTSFSCLKYLCNDKYDHKLKAQ